MVKYLSVGVLGLGVTGFLGYNMIVGTDTNTLLSSYENDIDAGFSNVVAKSNGSSAAFLTGDLEKSFNEVSDLLKLTVSSRFWSLRSSNISRLTSWL